MTNRSTKCLGGWLVVNVTSIDLTCKKDYLVCGKPTTSSVTDFYYYINSKGTHPINM